VLGTLASLAGADTFTTYTPALSGFLDTSNLAASMSFFRLNYRHEDTDADTYMNEVIMVGASPYQSELGLWLSNWSIGGNNGVYTLGTPISGLYYNDFNLTYRFGAVSSLVPVGTYDFGVEIYGGNDASARNLLTTMNYTLEVAQRLNAVATGSITPGTVGLNQVAKV